MPDNRNPDQNTDPNTDLSDGFGNHINPDIDLGDQGDSNNPDEGNNPAQQQSSQDQEYGQPQDHQGNDDNANNRNQNQNIPYPRFREVIDERNDLRDQLNQLTQLIQQQQVNGQTQQYQNPQQGQGQQNSAQGAQGSQSQLPPKPTRDQYQNESEYLEQLAIWSGKVSAHETFQQQQIKQQQDNELKSYQDSLTSYQGKCQEIIGSNKYPDFVATVSNGLLGNITDPAVNKVVFDHPKGPEIAYQIAKNPALAMQIANMGTNQALFVVGEIAAKIPGSSGQPNGKQPTGMPPPMQSVSGRPNSVPSNYSDEMSDADFDSYAPPPIF